jgi:hypothetical protein
MSKKNVENFFEASKEGNQKNFQEILANSHKSIIAETDPNGNNVIHIAAENNRGSIITAFEAFMKEHPAIQFNINDMNNFAQTPLDVANQYLSETQKTTIIKALESLSKALCEPLYTSESLRVLSNMQIEDFIHSEYDMKKSSKASLMKKDIEKIF